MAMNVFVSYKRPTGLFPGQLAAKLAAALSSRWGSDGRIMIDVVHAADTAEFATRLVNDGLNQCIAVIALVDAHWLHPRSSERLGATDDWITFEISYGFEHNLLVVLVCNQASRQRLQEMVLPGSMAWLKSAPWFEWRDDAGIDEQAERLVAFLRPRLARHTRLPPKVQATAEHSKSTVLTQSEAEQQLQDATWAYRALALVDSARLPLLVVGVCVTLWGLIVMLDHFVHGLILVGIASVFLGLAAWARTQRIRHLESSLTIAARTWR